MSDRKYEFRDWMDAQKLKVSAVCSRFGITQQTAFNWRSKGVPPSRQDFVSRTIAGWNSADALGEKITVQVSEQEFDAWNRAALDEGKTIKQWAIDGLNEMAKEYFENPQLPLHPLPQPETGEIRKVGNRGNS